MQETQQTFSPFPHSSLFQGVGGMLEKLHAKKNLKGLDDDQKLFYQSAIYAYEVSTNSFEVMLVMGSRLEYN